MSKRVPKTFKVLLCIVIWILLIVLTIFIKKSKVNFDETKEEENIDFETEFSDRKTICELATLKSYYHNVAEYEEEASGIFGFMGVGHKKFWIEYTGTLEAGIDASEVKISNPDENGVIKIYVPDARIMNASAENDSIKISAQETGIFTSIEGEDQAIAFSEAQKHMESSASSNTMLLNQAKERARQLLKEYVCNQGKLMGREYQIEWEDKN